MERKNKPKPPGGSVPTYIRFTIDQLAAMDEAIRKGRYINRSEAARDAVRSLFNIKANKKQNSFLTFPGKTQKASKIDDRLSKSENIPNHPVLSGTFAIKNAILLSIADRPRIPSIPHLSLFVNIRIVYQYILKAGIFSIPAGGTPASFPLPQVSTRRPRFCSSSWRQQA